MILSENRKHFSGSCAMHVGLDAGFWRVPLAGIGNYVLSIVAAAQMLAPDMRFSGFQGWRWRRLDRERLRRFAASRGKALPGEGGGALSPPTREGPGLPERLGSALSRIDAVRRVDRLTRAALFARSVGGRSLDAFYATSTIPPADPGVPVLPLLTDLSHVRFPDMHPAERVRWMNRRLPQVIEQAALVQTISAFSKREIIDVFGCPPDRIVVAPPAAAPVFRRLGRPATEVALSRHGLNYGGFLLTVGTLEPRKNLRALIEAYAGLDAAARRHAPLVVCGGGGWVKLDLPVAARRLEREETLKFLGHLPDAALRALYEGARLMLFPSIYEGFGMPVVEALACGTPVAHSSGTSMDEISGDVGRRVTPHDVAAWRQAMGEAIDGRPCEEVERARLVACAARYDWSDSAATLLTALRSVAEA
jgi:glycosyltransferase involved in cell wall biosynthesis